MNIAHCFFKRLFRSLIHSRLAIVLTFLTIISPAYCGNIHDAVRQHDVVKIEAILKEDPALVSSRDTNNMTPLDWAAMLGDKDVAVVLLANHADVNAKSNDGQTPLQIAAFNGYTTIVELLLTNHAYVNAKNNHGDTALHAAVFDDENVAVVLLANHADVNATNNLGQTPLHLAALRGNRAVVKVLLANHADANARDNSGQTPLDLAMTGAKQGDFWNRGAGFGNQNEVADLLRKYGGRK